MSASVSCTYHVEVPSHWEGGEPTYFELVVTRTRGVQGTHVTVDGLPDRALAGQLLREVKIGTVRMDLVGTVRSGPACELAGWAR